MKRKTDILIVLSAALLLSGCRLHRPDDVISPKRMEAFLYDYHLAQAVAQQLPRDRKYTTPAYIDWAYQKHGLEKEDVDRSLVWYTRNPKELAKIYKHLSNRIDDEYKSSSRILSQIEKHSFSVQSGDSVNLWYLNSTCLLNSSDYMKKVSFQTDRDTTFHLGDTLVWNVNSTFATPADSSSLAYMALMVTYQDSVSTVDTIMRKSGNVRLSLVLDDSKTMKNVRALIQYADTTDNRRNMLFASGIDMIRYHRRYVAAADSTVTAAELGTDNGGGDGNVQ